MSEVLTEITQLSELDCFHIVERHKTEFTYPLHRHREFELNFVEHGAGVRRIVGDSMETIGDYDLALIAAENLEHVWEDGNCKSPDIREITIQFSPDFLGDGILAKNQFDSIRKMLKAADHGISFPLSGIMKIYPYLVRCPMRKTISSSSSSSCGFWKSCRSRITRYWPAARSPIRHVIRKAAG